MKIIKTVKNEEINEISVETALENALSYANLKREDVHINESTSDDNYYYLDLSGDWMHYEVYIDKTTGEVMGINSYPMSYEEQREQLVTTCKAYHFKHLLHLKHLLAAAI